MKKIILTVLVLLMFQIPSSYAAETAADGTAEADGKETAGEPSYERVIAHGGGAYRGSETTNSFEALNHAIDAGYKVIELDMELSSDNKIIMLHDWDRTATHYYGSVFPKKLTQSQFTRLSVFGELQVLTFDKLAETMRKHQDVRIVTDTKGDNLQILAAISKSYPDLMDRFIPQIYDYNQWSDVSGLGYRDIILTLYAMADPNAEKAASFAREHGIYAVAMPDYMADRGLCRQIAGSGVRVYVHPVSRYEDALQYMKQGAYGVYSGSLLPEEFSGVEKDYYLTSANPGGSFVKLTDGRINGAASLTMHGLKAGETILYYIDGSQKAAEGADFTGLKPGKHGLTVRISDQKEIKGELTYYLFKDETGLRIVHKKYEYRLDEVKQEKDFLAAMQDRSISEEVIEILEHSLVAKEGEYAFYNNGILENYMNGEEFLAVQKGGYRKPLLPMSDTLRALGAESVAMGKGRDITIVYNHEKIMIMAESSIVRRGFMIERLYYPVELHLNKAMAAGEFYRNITGRDYLEKDGMIVILPAGAKPGKELVEQLFAAAGKLF